MAKTNLRATATKKLWKIDKNFFASHHPNDLNVTGEAGRIIDDFIAAALKGPDGTPLPIPPECGCTRTQGKNLLHMTLCRRHHGFLTDFFAVGRRQEKNKKRDVKRKMANLRERKQAKHDVFTSGKVVSGGLPTLGKKR